MDEFTITLIGQPGAKEVFGDIANEIDFEKTPYEVTLQDIMYVPGGWDNVREGANKITIREWDAPRTSQIAYEYFVPPGYYGTREELLKIVSRLTRPISATQKKYSAFRGFELIDTNEKGYPWHYSVEGKEIVWLRFTEHTLRDVPSDAHVKFCPELAVLFGVTKNLNEVVPWIKPGWKVPIEDFSAHRNNVSLLWVYADFIEPQMLANIERPLLRLLPVQSTSGTIAHDVFAAPQFCGVQRRRIKQFRVTIMSSFESSNPLTLLANVVVVLFFRKRL